MAEAPARQPSRTGTVPITAHLPPEIRDRLKILAARQRRTMNGHDSRGVKRPV